MDGAICQILPWTLLPFGRTVFVGLVHGQGLRVGILRRCLVAHRVVFLAIALTLMVAACADEDSSPETAPTAQSITTTTVASTTTVPPVIAGETIESWGPFTYMEQPNGWYQEPAVDVYAPVAEGPWPVVAVYHGNGEDKSGMEAAAIALAESGLVVFNFTWGGGAPGSEYKDAVLKQGPCTLWYTIEHAAAYGGDTSNLSLFGFSAGADMATGIAMKGGPGEVDCAAAPTDLVPVRIISGEGDYFLAPDWNRVLDLDPEVAEVLPPWLYIDTYAGPPIHLMFDELSRAALAVGDVPEGSLEDFIALRDVDGTLASDLEASGALDDNVLDWGETTQYLHDRLIESGATATLTWTSYGIHELGPEMMTTTINLAGGDPATLDLDEWIAYLND